MSQLSSEKPEEQAHTTLKERILQARRGLETLFQQPALPALEPPTSEAESTPAMSSSPAVGSAPLDGSIFKYNLNDSSSRDIRGASGTTPALEDGAVGSASVTTLALENGVDGSASSTAPALEGIALAQQPLQHPAHVEVRDSSPNPPERRLGRKRRQDSNIVVIEPPRVQGEACTESLEGARSACGGRAQQHTKSRGMEQTPEEARQEALDRLSCAFADDFFLGQGCTKLNQVLAANAGTNPEVESKTSDERPRMERFAEWEDLLRSGFSLLVQGVGSKKQLLHDFAEEMLKPAGIQRVHIHAFDVRFSMIECLKGYMEKAFPQKERVRSSAEAVAASVRAAVASASRPLCLVVHNLELLPQNHILILSSLAASPGVHLVASVDSIWAPLAWGARCLKDFNFCREECNTFLGYEVESAARFSNGLPPWTGLGHGNRRTPKASLSLVLRSLTGSHRELVQAMARKQLESGSKGGVSLSALLKESNDRMIASTVPKLRSLLNELRDHEVVVQRNSSAIGVQVLFSLPFDDRLLTKLSENASIDSDDEAEDVAPLEMEEDHSDTEIAQPRAEGEVEGSDPAPEAGQEEDLAEAEVEASDLAPEAEQEDCCPMTPEAEQEDYCPMTPEAEQEDICPTMDVAGGIMGEEQAPEPALVGPPDAPWHIDLDKTVPVATEWVGEIRSASAATDTWQCALLQHLSLDKNTVLGQVWDRWAKKAEDIASRHVSNAFGKLSAGLSRARGYDAVHAVLALAGSDVCDHEATLRYVEKLVRRDSANAGIAMVAPENFRSHSIVMRHISEQLMSGCTRPASEHESSDVAEFEEQDEHEWPEDLGANQMQRASMACFAEKLREHGSGGPVVLIVERLEAIPKDTLRDTLTSLGMALSDEQIPLFVVFGLQHPPQDCFDLFEGRPLVNLRLLDSAQLFDARAITTELLEWLVEDTFSVMALAPEIMDWLRRDRFEYSRQSLSHVLKSLALLCVQFFAGNAYAKLCAPLDDSFLQEHEFSKVKLAKEFEQRVKASKGIVELFQPHWEEYKNDAGQEMTPATQQAEVTKCMAEAATVAVCWRQRLIASLDVWDALCRSMQPMAKHEPRLRRLGRLLQELWPKASSTDQLSLADAYKEEQEATDCLVLPCISNITKDGILSPKEVQELLRELVEASSKLDAKLRDEITALQGQATKEVILEKSVRSGIKDWLHRIRVSYWLPLQDLARIAFREAFSGQKQDELAQKVEMYLVGKKGFTVESYLKPLSLGKNPGSPTPDDLALLYRLVECSASKSIEVADMWQAFKNNGMSSPSESTLLLRFGRGVLGLHAMGLVAPQHGGRGGTGYSFDQWRLRKKHFGRVWLKAEEKTQTDEVDTICSAVPESVSEVRLAIFESSQAKPIQLPAWAQGWVPEQFRGGNSPASLLKRKVQRSDGFDPSAKRGRAEKHSKPKLFMS